jgi:hypothetical protein
MNDPREEIDTSMEYWSRPMKLFVSALGQEIWHGLCITEVVTLDLRVISAMAKPKKRFIINLINKPRTVIKNR